VIEGTLFRNGDLSIGNDQSLTIKAGDTLVVTGDLILANKAILNVEPNGALIVRGDYTTRQQTADAISGGGVLVVIGKITFNGGGSNIVAGPGSNVYYDHTLNGDLSNLITGGGTHHNIPVPNSLYELSYGYPMPVKISNFAAHIEDKSIHVKWKISETGSVSYFEIQKSRSGSEFKTVDEVLASEEDIDYQFVDPRPSSGKWYYRVALVNHDKSIEYSPITEISFIGDKNNLKLYPNICKGDEINFSGDDIQNKSVRVTVFDLTGRSVLQDEIETDENESYRINFNKKLDKGNYYIHFVYDNQIQKQKFIVSY
jgi:hypothetical protein